MSQTVYTPSTTRRARLDLVRLFNTQEPTSTTGGKPMTTRTITLTPEVL
jgi:hypothetical protein